MKAELDARDIASNLTVDVSIKRYNSWRIRLWIALRLIEFAAWLAWVNVEVNDGSLTNGD